LSTYFLIPIGFIAGVIAGYLGIGGGGVFVPVLFYLCFLGNCAPDLVPKLSVGSSIGAVVLTGAAGAIRHWQLSHVSAPILIKTAIGAVVGAFFGGLTVCYLPGNTLRIIIGIVLLIAAARMITNRTQYIGELGEKAPWWLIPAGVGIGIIAATVGVGGGILAVPFFTGILKLKTKRAAGTSAALTLILGLSAIVGHLIWGSGVPNRPPGSVGFVVIQNSLALGIPAAFGAVLGAGFHKKFAPKVFKIVFALLLVVVGIKMLFV